MDATLLIPRNIEPLDHFHYFTSINSALGDKLQQMQQSAWPQEFRETQIHGHIRRVIVVELTPIHFTGLHSKWTR